MNKKWQDKLQDRFLRYVKIDTQSDEKSTTSPSTAKQLDLANMLLEELKSIGVENSEIDENGYVTARIPSNIKSEVDTIGFIAHLDTSPDLSGKNVNPKVIEKYKGGEIILNKEKDIRMSPQEFPELLDYVGEKIITTDGTTLLGADDKAGIAEIITAADYLMQHPEIKRGNINICFTPDEEIGRGADKFDVEKFGADFAYTLDGGQVGQFEYENFNAAVAVIKIKGRNVHPGAAKNKMINSQHIAFEFHSLLPSEKRPEHTSGYEGFYHLMNIDGSVENTELTYIIRDHDMAKFEKLKKLVQDTAKFLNEKYGDKTVELSMRDQYYNMLEKIKSSMNVIEIARKAIEEVGITPLISAIRGGTDGARLSYMGLPTPNIFAGGLNFHGRYEFVPLNSMVKAVEVILKINELNLKHNKSIQYL